MYESFFAFEKKPFDLLPNPEMLYLSRSHKRTMTYLDYGIASMAGFILLTGDIGSGKTTIIRNMVNLRRKDLMISKVYNTKVDSSELLGLINADFGLDASGKTRLQLLDELNAFLIERFAEGKRSMIIIDESQNLSVESLEEIRLLSNLETDYEKLLQIVLVGQPELRGVLQDPKLLQLRQRIGVNCHLHPLSLDELENYISFRMEKAGNRAAATFPVDAIGEIFNATRGIPRLVNILCDYLLLDAYVESTNNINVQRVQRVVEDLDFKATYWDLVPEKGTGNSPQSPDMDRVRKRFSRVLLGMERQLDSFKPFMEEMQRVTKTISERLDRIEIHLSNLSLERDSVDSFELWNESSDTASSREEQE